MQAARVHETGKIVIEEVPIPKLLPHEVLIAVQRAGICGTDVGVVDGHVPAKVPVTLGHEFSGTVAGLGSPGLAGLKEGEAVISEGGWGCGVCDLCRQGGGLYCRSRFSLGRTGDGCMAEFVKVDHRAVHRIPPGVSFDEAQNVVNVACALRAVRKLDLTQVRTAVVFGPGNAGLIIAQLLKLGGVEKVVMVGTRDARLEMAQALGCDGTVNLRRENPAEALRRWFPDGADATFEASGTAPGLLGAIDAVRCNGSIVVFGMVAGKLRDFDPSFLYLKEPILYGSKGAEGMFPETMDLLTRRQLQIMPMVTHRFPLAETAAAFQVALDKDPTALRIVIDVAP
jgi:threonine dehydrogenase-like Zn-dependent dehydrogenase